MIRAALLLFIAHGGGTVLSFLRNALIGRMVSVEDFGIVSTLALAFAIIETATYAGFDRMLVQDRDGHLEEFQANLQMLQILRGLTGMVFFLLFAWPYAWFLGNLEIYWAYLALSIVPAIRGFIHFDVYRVQRDMRFGPTALVTGGAPLASFLAVLALLPFVTDYRIMLIAIVVQQTTFVVLTHVFAVRKWRISWDRTVAFRAVRFGFPLLLNGALVFAIHNGDMLLVGRYLGMDVLGWYYVATLLTITPALHLDTTVRSIVLPRLSRSVDAPEEFARRSADAVEFSAGAAILILGFIVLLGPLLVVGLFGAKYDAALPYLLPLAILFAAKTLKVGPNVIALARAETMLPVYTNLPRVVSLGIAMLALAGGGGLPVLVAIAIVSELVCVVIAYGLALRPRGGGLRAVALLRPFLLVAAVAGAGIATVLIHPPQSALLGNLHWIQGPFAAVGAAALLLLPSLRRRFLTRGA